MNVSGVDPVMSSHCAGVVPPRKRKLLELFTPSYKGTYLQNICFTLYSHIPVMLHNSRRVGVLFVPSLVGLLGTGIVMVMGL